MPKETPAQAATVARVMHEFRRDELRSAGQKVRNPRQAIAIGLSEAGVSREKTPQQNRRARARADSNVTKADLLHQAARRGIKGRSRMTKADLEKALSNPG